MLSNTPSPEFRAADAEINMLRRRQNSNYRAAKPPQRLTSRVPGEPLQRPPGRSGEAFLTEIKRTTTRTR